MMMLTLKIIRYVNFLIIWKEKYITILYDTAHEYMDVAYSRQRVGIYKR